MNNEENQNEIIQENVEKVVNAVGKARLIYRRIVVAGLAGVLLLFILADAGVFVQTYRARNFIRTQATYVAEKNDIDSDIFKECIYSFVDRKGQKHEIVITLSSDELETMGEDREILYNEKDPEDFYTKNAVYERTEIPSIIMWNVVKIIALIFLIVLFFNKELLATMNVKKFSIKNK